MTCELNKEQLVALVEQAKQGDEAAFSYLYEYYLSPIYRFVFFRVKSHQEAEDLAQTVFIKAWNNLGSYQKQPGASFGSWLYTIARNSVIDFWKKRKEIFLDDNLLDVLNKKETGGQENEHLERKEKWEILQKALEILSVEQQEVMILKLINGLSNREISQMVGKNEAAIRQLQYRALKALKQYLKDNKLYE
ncbi:MAG: RNA polymerase sigma factor [Candidatus Pacebacteria bacterium]|nr:RNA polymerase sigma factor [Candidatus Paceibacterota bacterium]